MTATRRLAAILATDVAGYSRLMGEDEEGPIGSFGDSLSKRLNFRPWRYANLA